MVEEAHLLVEQAVDDVRPGVLPLDQADQLAVQRGTQVHRPVVTVQSHLERQRQPVRPAGKHRERSDSVRLWSLMVKHRRSDATLLALGHLFVQDTDEEEPLAGSQCCSGLVWTPAVRLLQSLEALEALVSYSEETKESVRVREKQRHSAVGPFPSTQRQSHWLQLAGGSHFSRGNLTIPDFFVACSLMHGA